MTTTTPLEFSPQQQLSKDLIRASRAYVLAADAYTASIREHEANPNSDTSAFVALSNAARRQNRRALLKAAAALLKLEGTE